MRKSIHKLSIFPGYIPPKNDELLSSWVFRIALAHKIKPFSFTKFYFEETVFWTRDVDKFLYMDVINTLTQLTPLSKEDILKLHLISYQDVIFTGDLNPANTLGISTLGIHHRTRKTNGLLACPSCLGHDPYYKKSWRLQTSLMCIKCNCLLIENCPSCRSPIIFHRLDIGKKNILFEDNLSLCWKCNFDLSKAVKTIRNNALLTKYQTYIDKIINQGYCKQTQYSFLYLDFILKILNKAKTRSKEWVRVREGIINEFNLDRKKLNSEIEISSFEFRLEILPLIYFLLDDIPGKFIPFCKNHNIRYSDFSKDHNHIPFWFFKIFRDY